MTDARPSITTGPAAAARAPKRKPLYRTVLGIAVASLVAAWLPFSVLYIGALSRHAQAVATAAALPAPAAQPANAKSLSSRQAATVTPVVTRTSGAPR